MNDNVLYTILITDLAFKADTTNELTSIKTEIYSEPYKDMEKPSLFYKYSKDTYNDIGSDKFTDVLEKEWMIYERADDFGFSSSALVYMDDELRKKLIDEGIQYIE